jgi:BirA family transcriptional regulator, biotin operon repressor / biotin---[acetyl-CoA-carboxylase] ligase
MTDTLDWSAAADPRRRIGHAVEYHASIGSTNDRARDLLAEPGGEGLAVVADLQTAGRGRRGRSWISPPGVNLMVSVGLWPRLAARDAWQLAAATSLAVREACRPWAELGVKWPNDLVDASGDKVAGLLLETTLDGERLATAVVGIGINVNWAKSQMPPEIADRAGSLSDVAGTQVDRVALLARLLAALDAEVAALGAGHSPLERYRAASVLDGWFVVVTAGSETIDGRVAGIDDGGSLLVDTLAGRRSIAYGEVLRIDTPAAVAT